MTSEQFFYSVLTSFIASFIFLFFVLFCFKPKIKISPIICRRKREGLDEVFHYSIKLRNTSLFPAYDINFELFEVERYPMGDGHMNNRYKTLFITINGLLDLPGYLPSKIRKGAPYACIVKTETNIQEILTDEHKSVMIKVSLRHGLTGLVKVFSMEYVGLSSIKDGKFAYGKPFDCI